LKIEVSEQLSQAFHPNDLARDMMRDGRFDHKKYNLPNPMCRWLDDSMALSPYFHAPAVGAGYALTFRLQPHLGDQFPIAPTLDREGTAYTSFQGMLIQRIASLRVWLVEHSAKPGDEEWFQNFRTLVTESVSLVDNTLHQIYFKAQYDPLPGWTFDQMALGQRHGRRLMDKLKWVYQITGKELRAPDETHDLAMVKELRNHLQHFDPPCFAYTLEEAATWLNQVLGVVRLVWRMRARVNAMPSAALISLLLQRDVRFLPKDPARPRVPMGKTCGYASTSASALDRGLLAQPQHEMITLYGTREEDVL
jgi:hypothetical protein